MISFDDFNYSVSQGFFKKLDNLDGENTAYSSKFIQSLINLEKYQEAYSYSKKIEKNGKPNFESNLFMGLYELKKNNYIKSKEYFDNLKPNYENQFIFDFLKTSLNSWIILAIDKNNYNPKKIDDIHPSFNNIKLINKMLVGCYIDSNETEKRFIDLTKERQSNFSRYNFFYANYLYNNNKKENAVEIINSASKKYPRNLLINQFKQVLQNKERNYNIFNCKKISDSIAEIFYVLANALASQKDYKLSNFYINLAKFLNPDFSSFNSLLAENFFALKKNADAEQVYENLSKVGTIYKWYSKKQIVAIMEKQNNENSIKFLTKAYKEINPNEYDTFDFANFLRNKEQYKESIKLYSQILSVINKGHKLYPAILERRGMAYERNDQWKLAEKDLIDSLKILPNEPYVMNYLAYTWVEKNQNIEKALTMLRQANQLKKNDGYITDSLGWALFKLKEFKEAKKYLERAIVLMPMDPIVNDHFADCLWMNNLKIQARYYWKNVLQLDDVDEELKQKIEKKILFGLKTS